MMRVRVRINIMKKTMKMRTTTTSSSYISSSSSSRSNFFIDILAVIYLLLEISHENYVIKLN